MCHDDPSADPTDYDDFPCDDNTDHFRELRDSPPEPPATAVAGDLPNETLASQPQKDARQYLHSSNPFREPDPASPYDPFHSSRLEAPETTPQHIWEHAGRSIECEGRIALLFRHSGWQPDRKRIAESLTRTEQTASRKDAFCDCGSHAYVLRNVDDPDRYRVAGSACHDRFCLPCASERSSVIANNVVGIIDDREIRFVTLTIRCTSLTLTSSLDKLFQSFSSLRRVEPWRSSVSGGVAFLEITWSKRSQTWHPHLHCLVDGTWIDQKALKEAWLRITGDSYIVDVRRPANRDSVARYVTKYASKPFNTTYVRQRNLLDEAIVALKGRRLCTTFGTWRGKILTATPDDGTWEHVASLDSVIARAASGNDHCRAILASLTNANLDDLYARAPPAPKNRPPPPDLEVQLEWFGAWQHDGTYKTPYDYA